MKILIADDSAANRSLLAALVQRMGHTVVMANNGQQAVKIFQQENPDLVLMDDVVMPVLNGLHATRRIKSLNVNTGKWTPIILVSAGDETQNIVQGIEAGADDYLTKPIDSSILQAKIRSMQQGIEWQQQVITKSAELESYYFVAEDEKRIAAHLMRGMTNAAGLRDPALEIWLAPTAECSGDLIAAARTPSGALHIMLADGTGHGLAAAINVLPLPSIFYAMTSKGYGIGAIAAELNTRIKSLMPSDRFVAATIASFDHREKTVEVWNGGNPDAWLFDADGNVLQTWHSAHLPLGILPSNQFEATTRSFPFTQDCQFAMVTDGLSEATNSQKQIFGTEHLLALLKTTAPADRLSRVKQDLAIHLGNVKAHDDISLVLVSTSLLPEENTRSTQDSNLPAGDMGSHWRVALRLGAYQLKHVDVIPFTLDTIKRLHMCDSHLGSLFLIISELFNNALDHGLLGLDSSLKNGPEGFDRYMEERETRLNGLPESASVEIDFEHVLRPEGGKLQVRVRDSGAGFDYQSVLARIGDAHDKYGRGLPLVKQLTQGMRYNGQGNEIIVEYPM